MTKGLTILVAIVLAVLGLAACGGDDEEGTTAAEETTTTTETAGGAQSTVKLSAPADGSLDFEQKSATAKAGTVTIEFDNPATVPHDAVLEDDTGNELGRTDVISQDTDSFTVELEPGTYTYFCSVPGHREGGMEGTLTVQ